MVITKELANHVHQPVDLISASGRNEVMSKPKVGTVHMIAIRTAIKDAKRLLNDFFANVTAPTCPVSVFLPRRFD